MAKGTLIQSINTVALSRKNWFQLVSYCHQLIAHYKLKNITTTFDFAWTLKKQKQRALGLGTVNGVKLSQLSAGEFGQELDKLMDAVDKENRDPSQPTGATTTDKQEPMQQKQGVLEECAEYMTMAEADGVAFKDSTLGTIIKQKAISIYCKWKSDMPLYHLCRLPLATPTWSLTNMAGLPWIMASSITFILASLRIAIHLTKNLEHFVPTRKYTTFTPTVIIHSQY